MMDFAESKPNHRTYFAFQAPIPREEWISILLKLALYLVSIGVGYLLFPR